MSDSTMGDYYCCCCDGCGGGDDDDELTQENATHEEAFFTVCYTRVLTGHQSQCWFEVYVHIGGSLLQ